MTEPAAAAAAALHDAGPYVLITGRTTPGPDPLIAQAQRHVVSPGPATRLTVAAGVALGGRRGVAVVDPGCAFGGDHDGLALTQSPVAAREALRSGWSIVQPWAAADVAGLLEQAPRPTLVLLASDGAGVQAPPDSSDLPPPRALRVWREGELATLVAAGTAVGPLVRIGQRLHARGVPVTVLEVAVLASGQLAPLVGGDALYVGGPDAGDEVARGGWPASMERVPLGDAPDADVVGLVLSCIRTA